MIIWFVGNSGSGKSTAAKAIVKRGGIIWLDGDAMRKVWPGLGFSKEDRWEQNMRIARLASALHSQGFDVVVSSICPYRKLRDEIRELLTDPEVTDGSSVFPSRCLVDFIFLAGGKEPSEEYPYEGRQPDEG